MNIDTWVPTSFLVLYVRSPMKSSRRINQSCIRQESLQVMLLAPSKIPFLPSLLEFLYPCLEDESAKAAVRTDEIVMPTIT